MTDSELSSFWIVAIYAFTFGLGTWLFGLYIDLPGFFAAVIAPFVGLALALAFVFVWSFFDAMGSTTNGSILIKALRSTLLISPWLAMLIVPITLSTVCACLLGQRLFRDN